MTEPASSPKLDPASSGALDFLRALVAAMARVFFTPVALLARRTIPTDQRNSFLSHLRPIALLLRRIFMVEALRIAPAVRLADAMRVSLGPLPARPQRPLDPQDSTRWPVTFCTVPPRENPRDRRYKALLARARLHAANAVETKPPRPPLREHHPTRPLALRLEALIRAAANPAGHIQRLARRFSRAMPRRVEALFAPQFTPWSDFNDHLGRLQAEVTRLFVQFADSS